jgi:hypothetical protein
MEKLVLMEAFAEVTGVMRGSIQDRTAQNHVKTLDVPFSRLNRLDRIELLNTHVDWLLYSKHGLDSEQAWRIVENAADGRPQGQWLEPVRLDHHHSPRPSLGEILKNMQRQNRSADGKSERQQEDDGRSM